MIFYIQNECFCFNKEDKNNYQSAIQKTININNNISISNDGYVVLPINNNKILYSFNFNSIINYNENDLANWLLYVYDMCHSYVSNLIDPNNKLRRNMPHMNAVKDVMYNTINKMILKNEVDVLHIIYNLVAQINESNPYDFYSKEANFLFFEFLLKWFNFSTISKTNQIFNKIIDNTITFISFKNTIIYKFTIKYSNTILKNTVNNNLFNSDHLFNNIYVNYKNIDLKTWFDNSKISLLIIEIINTDKFLEDIERIS